MAFGVQVGIEGSLAVVTGAGEAQLPELCALAEFAATVAHMRGCKRLLVDLLAVQPHLSFTEHLQLGTYVAKSFHGLERVATVVPVAERNGTSERAAQKSGLHLKTFTDAGAARAWLLAD